MRVSRFCFHPLTAVLVLAVLALEANTLTAQTPALLAPGVTIPVRLQQALTTQRNRPGDPVRAVTTQEMVINNKRIPAGTQVLGSVVAVKAFHFDTAPYAHQEPSSIAIRFTEMRTPEGALPLNVSVRALASAGEVRSAQRGMGTDSQGPITESRLIDGPFYFTMDTEIPSASGNVIAYKRSGGMFGRLLQASADSGALRCDAGMTEQAVGPFSPSACGAYGFDGAALLDGTVAASFTLVQSGQQAYLENGSVALLETR
jgi:hypothetical protein